MKFAGDLVHSEVAKLLTTRAIRWVVIAELALIAVAESGAVASGTISKSKLATPDGARGLLEHGGLAAIMTLVIGVTISAGEYRHRTITDTFLSTPRRSRVLAAKYTVAGAAGLVAGILSSLVALGTAAAWYAAKGVPFHATSGAVVRTLIGVIGWHIGYAVIGTALGAILRSQAAAIVVAVGWIFLAETGVAGLAVGLGRWLPATAARALGDDPAAGLLPQLGAAAVLASWAVAICVGAGIATKRRDVI